MSVLLAALLLVAAALIWLRLLKPLRRLWQLAYRDGITGLSNRRQYELHLERTTAQSSPFAVLLADIDHFRIINDGYGHHFGDQVIASVAERLRQLRQATSEHGAVQLYRTGGDQFALLFMPSTESRSALREQTLALGEQLRHAVGEPLLIQGRRLSLCLSVGVALYPEDGGSGDMLASAADTAMHQAKKAGRNNLQFAAAGAATRARQRLDLADELRQALATGALSPHFQPIVDLRTGHLVCAEALARWKHPVRGFVPPDEFIGVAEASGQIEALTEQLLRTACATAVHWRAPAGRAAPKLAFNLSARQVRQGVVQMIEQVLRETGLPAERLEIEITESAIIERPETAERLLREVRQLGVSVALDDFGTGYSSLSYLLRFPIDKIKVDRSFVSQLGGQRQAGKIVAATISLAANLEIVLVAEGVETVGQMVTLYELGCRQQQGWLFSKALPAEDFSRWAEHAPLRLDAVVRAQAEIETEKPLAA